MAGARRAELVHREPDQRRHRYWGMVALLAVIVSAFGVLASLSAGINREQIASFRVVPREPFVQAYSPIALALHGLPPDSTEVNVSVATPQVRAISMSRHNIDLYVAGKEVRSIYVASPVTTIQRLAGLVDNPAWIAETAPGQITLWSALTITPGVVLRIGAPRVHLVRMASIPSVFIGTNGGTLDFTGVTVEAVPPASPAASYYKPFVMATGDAVMDAANSTFRGLGWDWNASYGASWEDGSTGRVTGSTFEGGFIGVYTGHSRDMLFRDDIFRGNALYGLDPHSYSRGLVIDHVVAEYNHAHGIIFSNHVTNSVVEASISRDNGENGIMMDRLSTHNRIVRDTVAGNAGDGLVTSLSPHNAFTDNIVVANRIGIRVSPGDAAHTILTGNQLDRNALAEQNLVLDSTNATSSNGGQWDRSVLIEIWICAVSAMAVAATALAVLPRRRARHDRPRAHLTA
jgi:mannuronan 5-epimerase